MEEILLTASSEDSGRRIDQFITDGIDALTRSSAQRLCGEGHVLVDGQSVGKNFRIRGVGQVLVQVPEAKPLEAVAQEIPLDIIFEDEHLVVVNKPKGMVVHPAAGNEDGTLVNALLHHCAGSLSGIGGVMRPGIVHRIDKDTSGLLVVAKSDSAHLGLSEQVKAHSFRRIYHAVAYGKLMEDEGEINAYIARNPTQRKQMCVADTGREAVTHYRVLERYQGFTYLELRLETGRTHQIRVHLRYIGHPVAGDPVYGPKKVITSLQGQCLHAKVLGFEHPVTGEYLEFDCGLPAYFERFLRGLSQL